MPPLSNAIKSAMTNKFTRTGVNRLRLPVSSAMVMPPCQVPFANLGKGRYPHMTREALGVDAPSGLIEYRGSIGAGRYPYDHDGADYATMSGPSDGLASPK